MEPTRPTTYPDCYRHPGVEMAVRCHHCSQPICVDCMIDAPVGFQCPACVRAGAKSSPTVTSRTLRRGMAGTAPVTLTLIVLNAAVFVLGLVPTVGDAIVQAGAVQPFVTSAGGEFWRLASSMFIHGGALHLLFNMYALWILGPQAEMRFGSRWFVLLYLMSGLVGSALFVALAPAATAAVGASGAIFGLFGVMLALALARRHTEAGRAMFRNLGVLVVLNMFITFTIPGIAWQAHVGGFVFGMAAGWVFDHRESSSVRWATLGAGAAVCAVLVLWRAAQFPAFVG